MATGRVVSDDLRGEVRPDYTEDYKLLEEGNTVFFPGETKSARATVRARIRDAGAKKGFVTVSRQYTMKEEGKPDEEGLVTWWIKEAEAVGDETTGEEEENGDTK
jgi:hypothetical protein